MKCIIFLTLVALCYSYPYGTSYGFGYGYGTSGKTINMNQDGSITLTTPYGRRFTIAKGIGQNVVVDIDPTVSGYQYLYGYQKPDILAQILGQYQGDVSQIAYQQLLEKINSAVQSGQLSNSVYEALQNWNQFQVGQYPGGYKYLGGLTQGQTNVFGGQYQQYPYEQQVAPVGVAGYLYGNQEMFKQQGFGGMNYGTGINSWKTLTNSRPQYNSYTQFGQQVEPTGQVTGQLSQIIQGESKLWNKQNQLQQQQFQQQQQQQQLLAQQIQQQQLQQQQQNQQEYVQDLQQQVQQEQVQVLEQQKQQQYNTMQNMLGGAGSVTQTGQPMRFRQQQPGFFTQRGSYGTYGQGYNVPMVY